MKLLILLALCGTVYLMPMEMGSSAQNVTATSPKTICAPQTPCSWSVYNPHTREILKEIGNTYCVCPADLICQITEDDIPVSSYIHRCRSKDFESDIADR
ncbi:uncharacterized protein LOC106132059 [Amyelois transitella]|uniref:uncharacterized protein LOC106132059 n=1 Tax=Amyelois transitella TaxID=680683 RepID=UPI00067B1FE5|nr:uncharacterized protein LOC106132059 [Amyelois transitella]